MVFIESSRCLPAKDLDQTEKHAPTVALDYLPKKPAEADDIMDLATVGGVFQISNHIPILERVIHSEIE